MNLVVFNMSNVFDWRRGIVNRNFFIVRELIRSGEFEKVVLVDFLAMRPVSRFFGLRRTGRYVRDCAGALPAKKRLSARHMRWDAAEVFGVKTPVEVLSGLGLYRSCEKDMALLAILLRERGFDAGNTVLWSYNAFLPQAFEIPAAKKVFDAVDDWSLHASYRKEAAILRQNYDRIGRDAEYVFTVSEGLTKNYPAADTLWVPNGVDLDAFSHPMAVPSDIQGLSHPIIGYVGTVQERIDFALLQTVCKLHADKTFVFIGPVWKGVQAQADRLTEECPNVRFLGRRAYESVPAYLATMDLAIIPHRLDAFISTTNPMKMYDYLAAGKPIVTTPGAGTEMFAPLMSIVEKPGDFSGAITNELAVDSPEKRAIRQAAVKAHGWPARATEMLKHLSLLQ